MDFVVRLLTTPAGHDTIWVVIDCLTKYKHFLPCQMTTLIDNLAELYVREIILLYGVPALIVSDRDPRFTSHFLLSL